MAGGSRSRCERLIYKTVIMFLLHIFIHLVLISYTNVEPTPCDAPRESTHKVIVSSHMSKNQFLLDPLSISWFNSIQHPQSVHDAWKVSPLCQTDFHCTRDDVTALNDAFFIKGNKISFHFDSSEAARAEWLKPLLFTCPEHGRYKRAHGIRCHRDMGASDGRLFLGERKLLHNPKLIDTQIIHQLQCYDWRRRQVVKKNLHLSHGLTWCYIKFVHCLRCLSQPHRWLCVAGDTEILLPFFSSAVSLSFCK